MGNQISTHFTKKIMPLPPPPPPPPPPSQLDVPPYYTELQLTNIDYIHANSAWKLIIDNKCKNHLKKNEKNPNLKCVVWFYEVFYEKLFELFPEIKPLFKHSVDKQGKMLTSMISLLLNSFYDKSLIKTIKEMLIRHMGYGIKLYNFYIGGEILIYTLRTILNDEFTEKCNLAWCKVYSEFLRIAISVMKENEENVILHKIHAVHDKIISDKGGKYSDKIPDMVGQAPTDIIPVASKTSLTSPGLITSQSERLLSPELCSSTKRRNAGGLCLDASISETT
jgi:nitric oxide dioxygenase